MIGSPVIFAHAFGRPAYTESEHVRKDRCLEGWNSFILRRGGAACETSGKQQGNDFNCVRRWASCSPFFPSAVFIGRIGGSAGAVWRDSVQKLLLGGLGMKVVSFRSPKFLSGILRLIFGIKKSDGV